MKKLSLLIVLLALISFIVLSVNMAAAVPPVGYPTKEKGTTLIPGPSAPHTGKESNTFSPKNTGKTFKKTESSVVCQDKKIDISIEVRNIEKYISSAWCDIADRNIVDKCSMGPGNRSVTVHCAKSGNTTLTVVLIDPTGTQHQVIISMQCK